MQGFRKRAFVVVLALGGAAPWPSTANANGRFPGATQLVLHKERGVITSSFGVITTSDKFSTPTWSCERAIGYDPAQNNDLGAAIFGDGTFALSGPEGLSISTDKMCSNPKPSGPIADLWFTDVSVDAKDTKSGLAISRGPKGQECNGGELFDSADNGRSWKLLTALPSGFCPFTVDSAPSDPARIYVSGNVVGPDGSRLVARLLVSDDRGVSWKSHDIPNEARPFIGAIDPVDRNTVYIRTSNPPASGRLLVSTDSGNSFRELANLSGTPLQFFGVTGLAVSPDGSKLAYGSVADGLFVIDEKGGAAEKRSPMPVMCLTWTEDGLYACSAPNLCGPFFIGLSHDDGKSFSPLLATLDVNGDKTTCAPATPGADLCPGAWPAVRTRLGTCSDGGVSEPTPPDAGPADAGAVRPPLPKLACDCNVVGGGRLPMPWSFAFALLAGAGVVRRLRSRRREKAHARSGSSQ